MSFSRVPRVAWRQPAPQSRGHPQGEGERGPRTRGGSLCCHVSACGALGRPVGVAELETSERLSFQPVWVTKGMSSLAKGQSRSSRGGAEYGRGSCVGVFGEDGDSGAWGLWEFLASF